MEFRPPAAYLTSGTRRSVAIYSIMMFISNTQSEVKVKEKEGDVYFMEMVSCWSCSGSWQHIFCIMHMHLAMLADDGVVRLA